MTRGMYRRLSVIVPVFNEERTVAQVLKALLKVDLLDQIEMEIVVVDDCSTDNSVANIESFIDSHDYDAIHLFRHEVNHGKGAAIRTAINNCSGDLVVIQDADLEYDPEEFNLLLGPILAGHADVVYGSRFNSGRPHRALFFWHTIGNKFLTFVSNMFTNLNLSDIETCYKLFKKDILDQIELKEQRFGFEPEVTAKISRIPDIRVYEVGISYFGRSFNEGKKIGWKDGFRALFAIIKYNIFYK